MGLFDTVIGREPETDHRVIAETAAGLSIVDDNREISRQHLLIELVDWDVYVTDMETANGTWIRDQQGAGAAGMLVRRLMIIGSHGATLSDDRKNLG